MKDHPQSPWVEPAKDWAAVLQENEKLSHPVEELSVVIEKSKRVTLKPKKRSDRRQNESVLRRLTS